ncbi:aspartate dehydrogenase [Methanocaldococcus infernus]
MYVRVGLVGCGAIGSFLAENIKKANCELTAVYDRNLEKAEEVAKIAKAKVCESIDELVKEDLDVVVEAASVRAVKEVAEKSLTNGKDVILMSVGALADKELYLYLYNLSKKFNKRVYLPSGAIGGLDIIKALKFGDIKKIVIRTIKNPKAFNLNIGERKILFKGSVFEAIERFPANVNVSVTLSIAAKAPVEVWVIADPSVERNIHEIEIIGEIAKVNIRVENVPFEKNPKTSKLAAYSLLRLLKDLNDYIVVL